MSELVPGGNLPLPGGTLTLRVPGPFDVSAIVTGESGKAGGDADFVFYNQPAAPGVRLRGDTLSVEPARLRAGAVRVTVAVSAAEPGTPLGRLPAATLRVSDQQGRPVARFDPPRPGPETVLLLAELYRRGTGWKLRAIGQGYADGLAGLARDFGLEVTDDDPAPAPAAASRAPGGRVASPASGLAAPPGSGLAAAPASGAAVFPAPDPEGCLALVNPARARAGAPPVVLDARLVAAARAHAAAMAEAGRLATESPDGTSLHQRITAAGFAYATVGEHLVSGPRTPAEFVAYCLRTEQARRTLQDPALTHAGIAYTLGPRTGDTYWTAVWARPLTPEELARSRADVVELTNRERGRARLAPLAVDPLLTAAAQAHSADMVARDFYSHTSPEGSQPWDRAAAAGSRRRTIGENIACGQRSAAEVVEGWMNSPGHRANILKPDFTHIGVGFVGGGRTGTYWTQLFGG
ncbi:CAP domain-containing protein [Streptomyces shenzhenensis]|uniref:Stress protein n=1 Tax=Streptomyces shenzhenensis TaxID=943815 RepID=A0A3M0HVE5_9ACTN|nr:CAP domain-containing protein [Streptomyces shenzhenensis]RMB80048.1 stress protein [Streptomyces shenzhenensis]